MRTISNRRFLMIGGILIILMLSGSWFMGHASARGVVQTIDVGEPFDAQAHKNPLPANQRVWINGTYSASKIDNATVEFVLEPSTSNLYVKSVLTITPSGGPALTWGGYTTSENKINYSYGPHFIQYETWDSYFKEWLVLTEKPKSIEWQMTFDSRASVEQDANNYYVKFTDKEVTPFYITIPKPFVIDKNGINQQLSYSYNPGKNTLTLNLDDSGLTYPLVVDPVYMVDSTGVTGLWPRLIVNSSGFPMIAYGDSTNYLLKLAVNNSGTWSISDRLTTSVGITAYPIGMTMNTLNDLPIITSTDYSANYYCVTWFSTNKYRIAYTHGRFPASSTGGGDNPIGMSSSSNRVFIPYTNGTNGYFNITQIDDISGTTITKKNVTITNPVAAAIRITGEMNSSNILNIFWGGSTLTTVNWTTVTDAATPSVSTVVDVPGLSINATSPSSKLCARINPLTDLPAIAYVPYTGSGTNPDRYGRQINYTYYNNNKWYFEIAATNETASLNTKFRTVALEYNTSGTPYIAFGEGSTTANEPNTHFSYVYRTGPNTWSSPITFQDSWVYEFAPPSLAFDVNDGLHIAYMNSSEDDLLYYFEPLAVAGAGTAPVASFACTPIAGVRNATRTCTDASTNTPTSWAWWAPSTGNGCVLNGSLPTNQNPVVFPKNFSYCGICLTATNAFGSDSECKANYLYTSQPWTVF